ncbi:NAD-P-binding protein [Mycena latifolia]|nr:NAD-P-binding protein [Mycena latifolia]
MSTGPRIWLNNQWGLIRVRSHCDGRGSRKRGNRRRNLAHTPILDDLAVANLDRLLVVKCDVTKPDDILSAVASAIGKFGRVDVVFNNAGYGIVGEIEATPADAARAMFDVNFWGAAAVSKEAVRVFRDINPRNVGGRLLNVSWGMGFGAQYSYLFSKHALEGLTESLRLEMNPAWNIKISIIAPGAFKTRAHTTGTIMFSAPEAYSGEGLPSQALRQWFKDGSGIRGEPFLAAKAIFKFSLLDSPPVR